MTTNLDRFEGDLDRLIAEGDRLRLAMLNETSSIRDAFVQSVYKQFGEEKGKTILKKLPNFKTGYEAWYSESVALLRQLLPDRVLNFIALYEKPKSRRSVEYGNYVMQDYLQGMTVRNPYTDEVKLDPSAAVVQFEQQIAILKASKRRFVSSLYEIRQLVQADLFDSEIETARELLKNKFFRPAGAVAGVVLEKHLRQVCDNHKIKINKKNPNISDLNELLKTGSVIEIPQWRHISMLADIRNLCDHHKQTEPSAEQVADLINGVDKVIKTIS
jgi:hypothetical protein